MKRQKTAAIIVLALICILCAICAFGCAQKTTYYTVTFMDGLTQVGETVKVQKGKKIPEYPSPEREDTNYVFDGWFKDEELEKVWNHDIERVTKDITLWAGFLYVPATPSNVAMDGGAFSNTVVWLQRGVNEDTQFSVEIFGAGITSAGKDEFEFESYRGHDDIFTVSWTPAQKPLGGVYSVTITGGESDGITVDGLMFKGAGTYENPYLVTSSTDLAAVNTCDVAEGSYYKIAQSFTARLSANAVAGNTFDGVLFGNGKTITLEASDFGLFGTLGENAQVKDLTLDGAVSNVQTDCVGAIAGVNHGEISYCTVTASLDSARGVVGNLVGDENGITGGIAGIAGINYGGISSCTYSGAAKSNVGGAGITVINNGTVSLCSFEGTLGAGNSEETGNSTKAYSYMGGIAAINYGLIEKSSADGSGKLLAQRGAEGTNDNIGGIVAVNKSGATVSECFFDGIRVHGNKNVGGIAGVNSGTVIYCYAGADYHGGNVKAHSYVGGLGEVGGIVGLSDGGMVANCFVTSSVYAYSGNAYKVAQTSENCIYLGGNVDEREGVVTVIYDGGNGNLEIELVGDYSAKAYPLTLTEEQLAVLNGNGDAFTDLTNVRLVCEGESGATFEHIITIYLDGIAIGRLSDVSGNTLSLKDFVPEQIPEGCYFAGWTVTKSGGAEIDAGAQLGYATVSKYGTDFVTIYPVFSEGVKPSVLSVALWSRYVDEQTVAELLEAFKTSAYYKDNYQVSYTVLTSSNNNNYQTDYDKGDYNVTFAYKSTAVDSWQTNILSIYIFSVNANAFDTLYVGLNSSDDVVVDFGEFLQSDAAKKITNPDYISEEDAEKIEITLMSGGGQYGEKLTLSNATEGVNITLGEVEAEEGYAFAGWALTETETDGEILLKGSKSYADLVSYADGGKLTLYARFIEIDEDKVVVTIAIHASAASSVYISDSDIKAIQDGFESYLDQKGVSDVEINWCLVYGKSAAGFANSVEEYEQENNLNVNVAVGGSNMTFTFDETYGLKKESSGLITQTTNRYVGVLSGYGDNEIAVMFYEFMTTVQTV